MLAATDRLEFAPPPTPGWLRSMGLALLAHAFLLAALTWGVHWKSEPVTVTAEAELWSAMPQEAAPKLLEEPPEPPTPPEPPAPIVKPAPPRPAPVPVEDLQHEADIALAQEKQRLKKEKQLELQKQKEAALKLEKLKLDKLEQENLKLEKLKLEKLKLEKLKQEKLLLEKKQLADKRLQDQRELDKKAAEAKKKTAVDTKLKDAQKAQQDKQEAQKIEAQRSENLKRMAGLAGASGDANAKGSALKSSGPSASYGGRIRARIKPNIVFTDEIVGNPQAEVEVRTSPDGTIISRKLIKPSGDKSWDEAVLRAIDRTEKFPPDVDGRVPPTLIISFRPKD